MALSAENMELLSGDRVQPIRFHLQEMVVCPPFCYLFATIVGALMFRCK